MFNPTNIAVGLLSLVAVFLAGGATDHFYGPNAWWKANRQAEDRAKNAVLTDLAEREDTAGFEEEQRFKDQDKEFHAIKVTLTPCVLTAAQASALNQVGE